MQVLTTRQLVFSERGKVPPDTLIDLPDKDAEQLLRSGAVRRPPQPAVIYEVKVVQPEVRPEPKPFRDVHNANNQTASTVDRTGDKAVSGTNLAERVSGIVRRKRGRPRKHPA